MRCRSRAGITCRTVARARDAGSSNPVPATAHRLQCDREHDGLVVVEEEWRQLGAGIEAVPAIGTLDGLDAVAELAKPVDVTAHGAIADVQPLGQQPRRPVPPRLQERQQGEHAG